MATFNKFFDETGAGMALAAMQQELVVQNALGAEKFDAWYTNLVQRVGAGTVAPQVESDPYALTGV